MNDHIFKTLALLFVVSVVASAQNWTWMKGGPGQGGASYGILGVEAPTNLPGPRDNGVTWTDPDGIFWLFGGNNTNDLWRYRVSNGQWTWMKGSNVTNQFGSYGTLGQSGPTNTPGSRVGSVTWADASGNLWLFGGSGNAQSSSGYLNDLWKYNIASSEWTWVHGDNTPNHYGIYGTKGVPAQSNAPGSRSNGVSWIDASGNLWMLGGYGYALSTAQYNFAYLNDFWKFDIATGYWT
jgi:hypothetical protein